MKHKVLILLFSVFYLCVNAQTPTIKVDLNMSGRSEAEVNEPGYTPWSPGDNSASMTESDVTFTLTATAPEQARMKPNWNKALVQGPNFMRLVADGVHIENDDLVANPNVPAKVELKISGLPVGNHTIQTYHNSWDSRKAGTFNVFLNGELIHSEVSVTNQVLSVSEAKTLFTDLKITEAGQDMTLSFEAIAQFEDTANMRYADHRNFFINGFELNSINRAGQAVNPVPANRDLHIDADNGGFKLEWEPATDGGTVSHLLYVGLDSAVVAQATPESGDIFKGTLPLETQEYQLTSLYSMNTYYWRVDQQNAGGAVTQGEVWSFKPRQLAFYDAEGYGRFATGGRGGKVVYVTNLNDNGPGSFREAATDKSGPRTIVFNVSGIIRLESRLVIDPFVTVAGQTAPGKGICFAAAPVGVNSESICRFIRTRIGAGPTYDGMGMAGSDHSIIDHCSISWGIDECFSSRGAKNITLQRTMISEALNIAGHQNYPDGNAHGYAGSVGGDVGSLHHNLLAHNNGRNWSLAGGTDGAGYYAGRMDIFNMVVYNYDGRTTDGGAHEVNFVNNYYKEGPASGNGAKNVLVAQLEGAAKGTQSYYVKGNILQKKDGRFQCDGTDDMCAVTYQKAASQILDWEVWVEAPFFPSYATVHSAKDAYKHVLSDVGCTMPALDDHDRRIVRETLTGTYTYTGSRGGDPGIIDHHADAGGFEDYGAEVRGAGFDSDMDGLPDWWENEVSKTGPNSAANDFSDSNADPDGDGFTNLEDYLEWLSRPHYYLNNPLELDLAEFTRGFEESPVRRLVSAENCNVNINGIIATITKDNAAQSSLGSFEFEVEDTEGAKMTRSINFSFSEDYRDVTGSQIPVTGSKVVANKVYFDTLGKIVPEGTKGMIIEKVIYEDGSFSSRKLFIH